MLKAPTGSVIGHATPYFEVALPKAVSSFVTHFPRAAESLAASPVLANADSALSLHCTYLPETVSAAASHFWALVGLLANAVAGSRVLARASVSKVRRIIVAPFDSWLRVPVRKRDL